MLGNSVFVSKRIYKLYKSKLILKALMLLKSVNRKLMKKITGLFNFIFTIGGSFIGVWYDQLKLCSPDSSSVVFSWSPSAICFFQNRSFYLGFRSVPTSFILFCRRNSSSSCSRFRQGMLFLVPWLRNSDF